MDVFTRFKKWVIRLFVLIRKNLRKMEAHLDRRQPHPAFGVLVIVAGVLVALAGVAMLVLPGPGMLVLALGVVGVMVGVGIIQGKYGPERLARERAAKHERLRRRRARQCADK